MRDSYPVVVIVEENEPMVVAKPKKIGRPRDSLYWASRAGGVALTTLLHLLISAPLVLGTAAHQRRPTPDGIGTTAWASQGEHSESMILIDLSSLESSRALDLARLMPTESADFADVPLMLVSYEPSPPPDLTIDEESAEADETTKAVGESSGNAALFGKYMGQVAARIERAWMRPRAPIQSGHFECQTTVTQDTSGNVLSIGFGDCSDDAVWRKSLESAIWRSSPLSAPPEPWLFTPTVTLSFSANQYERGLTPDYQYEPMAMRAASATLPDQIFSSPSPNTEHGQSFDAGSEDVELTINGSKVTWKKRHLSTPESTRP